MGEKEVRLSNVYDGEIKRNPEFSEWVETVAHYVCESLGREPILRLGAYQFGATVGVAIDCFARENDERSVPITVILSGTSALLPEVKGCNGQLDIVLAGVLDVFHLVDILQKRTNARIKFFTI